MKFMATILLGFLGCTELQGQSLRGLYVDAFDAVLGNAQAETDLLTYAQANNFNYLILYELWPIHQTYDLTNPTSCAVLADFIDRAHTQFGIEQVGATGENAWFFENVIVPYQQTHSTATERFDVFNVEFEFWNEGSTGSGGYYCTTYLQGAALPCDTAGAFAYWQLLANEVHALAQANNALSEVYVGWFNQGQAAQFAHAVDRILLHDYVSDPLQLFSYVEQRLYFLATGPQPTQVAVIFSAEPEFLGPYLQTHTLLEPFTTVSTSLAALDALWTQDIDLIGYQWFDYGFAQSIVTSVNDYADSNPRHPFPNPASGRVFFSADVKGVSVSDHLGRTVLPTVNLGPDHGFDISDLEAGPYLLSIIMADGRVQHSKLWVTD